MGFDLRFANPTLEAAYLSWYTEISSKRAKAVVIFYAVCCSAPEWSLRAEPGNDRQGRVPAAAHMQKATVPMPQLIYGGLLARAAMSLGIFHERTRLAGVHLLGLQ